MAEHNPYQSPADSSPLEKPPLSIPQDPTLILYCHIVGFSLFLIALLLLWPVIFNLLMATDNIASIVRFLSPQMHYLIAFIYFASSLLLFGVSLLTFKMGNSIRLGEHPDFVFRVAIVHIFYFPLGTILFFWLRSVVRTQTEHEE